MKEPKRKKSPQPLPRGGKAMGRLRQFQLERGLEVEDKEATQGSEKTGEESDHCNEERPQDSERED